MGLGLKVEIWRHWRQRKLGKWVKFSQGEPKKKERILGHKALENVSVKGVKRNMGVYKGD